MTTTSPTQGEHAQPAQRFTKKPVVIDAKQASGTPESNREIIDWTRGSTTPAFMDTEVRNCSAEHPDGFDYPVLKINTLEGTMTVAPGDWIIKGVKGEFYPCKPDIFEATYSPAGQPASPVAQAEMREIDWSQAGLLMEAHATTREFITGTTNWAAAICSYMLKHSDRAAHVQKPAGIEHVPAVVSTNGAESNMTGGAMPERIAATWLTDPAPSPERQFCEWLNSKRGCNVSEVFHEIMQRFASHGQAPAGAAGVCIPTAVVEKLLVRKPRDITLYNGENDEPYIDIDGRDLWCNASDFPQESRWAIRWMVQAAQAMLVAQSAPTAQAAPAGASHERALEEAMRERDEADDFIDTLLDEVLGADRAEWSSAYGRAEALEEVRERITALHRTDVDRAWTQFQAATAQAAPVAGAVAGSKETLAEWALRATPEEFNAANWGVVHQGLLRAMEELEKTGIVHSWIGPYIGIARQESQRVSPTPAAQADSYDHAKRLAESLWNKHYREAAPLWQACDDLPGVLSQIDNMVCGLTLTQADSGVQEDAARYRWLRVQDNEDYEFAVVKNPHFDVFESPKALDAAIDAGRAALAAKGETT